MSLSGTDTATVIELDLRSGAHTLADPAALRAAVREQLRQEGLPEPDDYRFLLVDTPRGLTDHHRLYERILGYRTIGTVRVVCLVVGDLSDDPGADGGPPPDDVPRPGEVRRLRRPAVLRAPAAGLLWAADLRAARTAGDPVTADDPDALAVLVALLRMPGLFDETLDVLSRFPEAVAVPGVRVLEHDLSDTARARAWRQALVQLAGEFEESGGSGAPDDADRSTGDLPKPVDELAAGRPVGAVPVHRASGGAADRSFLRCHGAVEEARGALDALGGVGGLFTGATSDAVARALGDVASGLADYRDLVARAVQEGAAPGASVTEAVRRLADMGIVVPPYAGTREETGEGLRRLAKRLLGERLSLRGVANRFSALSEQTAPLAGAALVPEVDRRCPPDLPGRVTAVHPFRFDGATAPQLTGAFLAAGLASLWPWPGTLLSLLVLLVLVGGSVLAGVNRPNRAAGGQASTGAAAQALAAVLGCVGGLIAAAAWEIPAWVSLTGLLAGLGLAAALVVARWRRALDRWWERSGASAARRALESLDLLLAEAVAHQWWACEERMYCANAARSLAGMLRSTAAAAEDKALGHDRGPGPGPSAPAADDLWGGPLPSRDGAPDDTGEPRPEWMPAPDTEGPPPDYSDWAPDDPDASGPPPSGTADGTAGHRGAGDGPPWLEREASEGGPLLVVTLVDDLTAAVVMALEPYWGAVERGQAGGPALSRIEEHVRDLLDVAHRHLSRNGPVSPPPFARGEDRCGDSEGLLGIGAQRVVEATDPDLSVQRVMQLVSQEQSPLLSRDPNSVEWIRFAPAAVRHGIETAGADRPGSGGPVPAQRRADGPVPLVRSRSVWTASGRYAGLLRLVPLRSGVVESVRLLERSDGDPPSSYGGPYEGPHGEGPYGAGPYDYGGGSYDSGSYGGGYGSAPYGDEGTYGAGGSGRGSYDEGPGPYGSRTRGSDGEENPW